MTNIISTRRLSRRYGQRTGIEAVDLEIGRGEIFGFLGPNGAGKSTTIRLLLGFLRPSAGAAFIDGLDCWSHSAEIKRTVGYLPGDLRLYGWMNGRSALRTVGRIRGLDLSRPGGELAERFQLELDVYVRQMSRGMRQKLGLILALAHQPRLLILDEPAAGLDPLMQEELAACLRERAAAGDTVFFSSHSLGEVESLCDRVAIVRRGRIVADESLDSLRNRARRTVEVQFADDAAAGRAVPAGGDLDDGDGDVLPSCLHLIRREGRLCVFELEGPAPPVIRWAGRLAIEDISISPPDLESLFRRFYETDRS